MIAMIDEIADYLEVIGGSIYNTGNVITQVDEYNPFGIDLMVKGGFLIEIASRIENGRYDITSVERVILTEEVEKIERLAQGIRKVLLSNTKNIDD